MADISINPVTRRTQYTGNTGLGPFSFNFNILQNTDIVVYKNSTLLTLTTDYTVTINANGTGSVTLTGSGNGTALVLADLLTIVGGRELSRTTDFVTAGDLLASSLNEQLDSNVIMVQQLDERFDRAMKLNIADEDGDLTLPLKSSRAGKTLAFDSSGNPVVGEDIGNWRGDWVSGTTYTVRDLVKDGSNENVYRVNTAHTSSGTTPLSSNTNSSYYDLVVDAESAATSASNAASSASAAASSASAASTSASNAATSATNASNSASAASTSASNAATSETNASNSATSASTSASNASTSATNAATSASNASTSETNAASSASSASTSATSAATSASSAATSATNAGTSAGNASTSETNAANSASAAATSASNASTSESNAAASAASAAASFDAFDDIYLGAKASDPTVDNDGDALTAGDQYFNTTTNVLKVYNGSAWQNTEYSDLSLLDDVNITTPANGSLLFYDSGTSKWIDNPTTNITSVGTLTGFTSTGIDDNATSTAIQIDSNGDISFYEDTGTTPKFFWDASAEALAVGGTNTFTSKIVASAANGTAYSSNSQLRISGGGTNNNRASIIFSDDALSDGKISYYPHATESSRLLSLSARTTESDFVIKGDGNVGIGTSSPSAPLTVNTGSDGNNVYIDNNGTQLAIGSTSSVNYINTQNGNAALAIQTNGTERLRVDASGNVGIGTSSPTYVLDVYSSSVSQISASRSGGSRVILGTDTSTGEYVGTISNTDFKILTNSSARMRITNTGAIFMPSLSYASASTDLNYNTSTGEVFVVTSSMRYKSNIADLDIDTSKVLALRPVSYTDNNSGINAVGLIAEEVHEEIPQLVNYKEIEGYDEIQPDSVKYSTLSVYLLKVIQEQQTIIEDLKARITTLENA